MTQSFMDLRLCERFGREPGWIDTLPPGAALLLRQYERIRQQQESR